MSEGGPVLEQIDKNPETTAKNSDQKFDLRSLEETSKVIQETNEDLVGQYKSFGMSNDEARLKAEKPMTTLLSDVMGKKVNEALANGTDEYAIMAGVHKGAEEGRLKSKMGSVRRIVHELFSKFRH